jgi:hypothetical protein
MGCFDIDHPETIYFSGRIPMESILKEGRRLITQGIIAHQSALRGGSQIKNPQFDPKA